MRIAQFAKIIHDVESIVLGRKSIQTPYFQTSGDQRYVKAGSARPYALPSVLNHVDNPDLCLIPRGLGDRVKWAKRRLFNRVYLPCVADIILLRKNLSLFYIDQGIRIKIETDQPNIPVQSLAKEFEFRKKVERMGDVKVPPIVDGHVDAEPLFFVDELVQGTVLNWKDSRTQDTFRRMIPDIWRYYQNIGIHWKTPEENGHDIERYIGEYKQALKAHPDINFPFDLKRIGTFYHRLLPCTQIHGDLAIHNIILSSDGDFLLDWEASTFDYMLRDFHRLLIIPGWSLDHDIETLMEIEIDMQRSKRAGAILSFSEQLYFILFLEIHKMLTTPRYPVRLLRKAKGQMETFYFQLHVSRPE